jgi:lysophospholipase L1-like esterase
MRSKLAGIVVGMLLVNACGTDESSGTGAGGSGGSTGAAGAPGLGGSPGAAGSGPAGAPGRGGSTGSAGSPGVGGSPVVAGSGGHSAAGAPGTAGEGGSATGGTGPAGSGGATGTGGSGATGGSGKGGGNAAGAGGGQAAGGNGGGSSGTEHWVGTWTGAPQLTETANNPPASLSNAALRQIVHVSLGGSQIRVRFSNEFGNGNVVINKANVAVTKNNPVDSAIDTATDKALSFSGMPTVTIAQGKAVWSDPLDFTLAPLSNLTITIAFGSVPSNVTGHPGSRTTSYEVTGSSNVSAATMSGQTADHWYIISGVDVMADAAAKGLVILGDSITDGKGSTTNANNRWPDLLAKRMQANSTTAKVSVMNQGIGGNNITTGGLGPTATDRYMRDVLGQSGVKYVIVFEGVNDIGGSSVAAGPITSAMDSFISKAHAAGLLIYGATVTPFVGNSYYTAAHETVRQSVNTYIKSGKFDGYIDFDAAVKDTSNPPKLQSTYDSGDGLHLTPAGYQKMADTVDLTLLTK